MQAVPDPAAPPGQHRFPTQPRAAPALLNPGSAAFRWCDEPFAVVGAALGLSAPAQVLAGYAQLQREGALSRIGGGVCAGQRRGAILLAAMAVPPERLDAVAAVVSSHPGVNHNYEREHALQPVVRDHRPGDAARWRAMRSLEDATGLTALRLPMLRPTASTWAFDLRPSAPAPTRPWRPAAPAAPQVRPAPS
jgi:hypothetical protein